MALQVWLPLNGNVNNQGLSDLTFSISSVTTINDNGKIGKCYENNSFTTGGLFSDKTIDLGQNQSMFCWFKINSLRSNSSLGGGLVTQHNHTLNQGMGITIRYVSATTGYLSVNTGNGTSRTYNTYYGKTLLQAGTWYHGGYTYDGTTIRLYVNGSLDGEFERSDMKIEQDNIQIFRWSLPTGSFSFNGCLNDVRIYDNVLSPREIKEISKAMVLHYTLSSGGSENILLNTATPMELDASVEYRAVNSHKIYSSTLSPKQLLLDGAAHGLTLSYDINVPAIYIDSGASLKRCGAYLVFKVTNKQTSDAINYYGHHTQSGEPTNLNTYTKTNALNNISSSSTASNPDTSFNGHYSRTIYPNQFNGLSDFYNNPDNYDVTFTGCHIEIRGGYIKDKCSISNLKLEVGDKATPWTPNPADDEYAAMGYDDPIEYDVSGYGNNGELITPSLVSYSSNTVKYNVSTVFGMQSSSSFSYLNTIDFYVPDEFTISYWWYYDSDTKIQSNPPSTLAYAHTGSGRGYMNYGVHHYDNHFYINFAPMGSDTMVYGNYVNFNATNKAWNFVTLTFDGYIFKVYKNGELIGSWSPGSSEKLHIVRNDKILRIGYDQAGGVVRGCAGNLSDFRIYATPLTADEITDLYYTPISLSNNGTLLTQGELLEV